MRGVHAVVAAALASATVLGPVSGCGPRVSPRGPGTGPTEIAGGATSPVPPPPARPAERQVIVGEMCPAAADGRPAALLLAVRRSLDWTSKPEEVEAYAVRAAVPSLTVLAYGGRRAGTFTVAGPVDLDTTSPAVLGGYAGAPPCDDPAIAAECAATRSGCGLAVGVPGDEAPAIAAGGACAADGRLLVDLDGDGHPEAYSLETFLDATRAPAEEVLRAEGAGGACAPRFASAELLPGTDPKAWRGLDLVGVLDLDADGRHELVLQYRYGHVRSWAVYAAPAGTGRLELVAEIELWP